MTRRRFIADEYQGDRAALVGDHAAHLSKVLRAKVGQEVDIVADGLTRRGEITSVAAERVDFQLHETIQSDSTGQPYASRNVRNSGLLPRNVPKNSDGKS